MASHIRVVPSSTISRTIPHNSFWAVQYLVPGGRSFMAVTDDFGNLREVDPKRAQHSSLAGSA